jgi:hypothetical protein
MEIRKQPLVLLRWESKDTRIHYFEICFNQVCTVSGSQDSSVGIALRYGLDDRGSRVQFPAGLGIFLFTAMSRPALMPTQPPIQWVPRSLSLEVKRPGREADHSPPSSAKFKNMSSYTFTPPIHLHGVVLT